MYIYISLYQHNIYIYILYLYINTIYIYIFAWTVHLKLNQGIQLNATIKTLNYIPLLNNYFLKVCNRKLSKVIHIGRFAICLFQFSSRIWLHLKWMFSLLVIILSKNQVLRSYECLNFWKILSFMVYWTY